MNDHLSRREFVQRTSLVAASLAGLPTLGRAAEAMTPAASSLDLLAVRKPLTKFIVVTDTHYAVAADGSQHPYLTSTDRIMSEVQAAGANFIIHLGDITNSMPTDKQYAAEVRIARDRLGSMRAPVYAVPGNHDVGNKLSLTSKADAGHHIREQLIESFLAQFKTDYHVIDHSGCRIILLNCLLFNSGLPRERQQWDRLQADLEGAKGAQVVIGFHMPLFWHRPDDIGPENYHVIDEPVRGRFLELLRKYKVRAVFTGHAHHPILNTYGDSLLLTAPATSFAVNYGFYPQLKGKTTPSKLGWLLVRIYENDLLINRFRPRAAELTDSKRILVTRQPRENPGSHLATMISAPRLFNPQWMPSSVIDGRRGSAKRDAQEDALMGWSSNSSTKPQCHEWVRLTLPSPETFDRVVLWPRFKANGSAMNFPTDFVVQATADGKAWTTLKQFEGFQPDPNKPVIMTVPAQKALALAVVASRLPEAGASGKYNFQLMEFELFNGQQPIRPAVVHASSSLGGAPRRLDAPLLESSALGARYLRLTGALNSSDYVQALLAAVRLGHRPVVSLPPEPKVVPEVLQVIGKFAGLIEAPDPETFKAATAAGTEKPRLMIGPASPDRVGEAVATGSVWVSVLIDGTGKNGRTLANEILAIRKAHMRNVFWFDILNPEKLTDPAEVAQLFLLTYGIGVIINPMPCSPQEKGDALLDANFDPTPAHHALQTLATVFGDPMKRSDSTQGAVNRLWFAAAGGRFVEALWTDAAPVTVTLGAERAGAALVDLSTGWSKPLAADTPVQIGRLPVIVCKL